MRLQESKKHTPSGSVDNRFMWLTVDCADGFSAGDQVNIGSIKPCISMLGGLGVRDCLKTFTITQIRISDSVSIEITPAIILDGQHINCNSIACIGDEVVKI